MQGQRCCPLVIVFGDGEGLHVLHTSGQHERIADKPVVERAALIFCRLRGGLGP